MKLLMPRAPRGLAILCACLALGSTLTIPVLAQENRPTASKETQMLVSDSDHVQLTRLIEDYVWRVDNGMASTIHELFVEDGIMDTGQRLDGRAEILAWGEGLDAMNLGIRHVLTNPRFVMTGPDRASGTSTLTAYLMPEDGVSPTLPYAVGQDVDEFVRTPDGWRFASRHWELFFGR